MCEVYILTNPSRVARVNLLTLRAWYAEHGQSQVAAREPPNHTAPEYRLDQRLVDVSLLIQGRRLEKCFDGLSQLPHSVNVKIDEPSEQARRASVVKLPRRHRLLSIQPLASQYPRAFAES